MVAEAVEVEPVAAAAEVEAEAEAPEPMAAVESLAAGQRPGGTGAGMPADVPAVPGDGTTAVLDDAGTGGLLSSDRLLSCDGPVEGSGADGGPGGSGPGGGGAAVRERKPLSLDEWARLFEVLRPAMRSVLARYQIPPEEAEDLVQTTYLEALKQAAKIRHPEAWMIGTLRHHCLEHRRKAHRLRRRQVSLDSSVGEGGGRVALDLPVVEDGAETVERRLYLLSLLRPLPVKLRVLLVGRYLYGRVDHEVAKRVGLAASSLRKTTQRALRRARAEAGRLGRTRPGGGTAG